MPSNFLYGANVHANGIRQHYLRYGGRTSRSSQSPAVIIIPGITSPAVTWGFVGEVFGQNFETYVLDVRGRGLSEASENLDYSLDAQADDLAAFVSALNLQSFSFVGHSMGARIAARAVKRAPRGLTSIVLVDPPVSGPGRREYPGKRPWYADSMALARKGTDADEMRGFCPTWTEEQLQLRAEWLHTCDERAVVASLEGFHNDDFHTDVARLDVPSLLITAERGDVVRDDDVRELKALNPTIEHVRVREAGHMIPWDNPRGFYEAFGTFLGSDVGLPSQGA